MMNGMDPALLLSTLIAAFGITAQILASRRPVAGWSVSLAIQPLWYAFYFATGGYALMLLSTGYAYAAFLHLRRALRAGRKPARLPRPARRRRRRPVPRSVHVRFSATRPVRHSHAT